MRTFQANTGCWTAGMVWVCEDGKKVSLLNPHFEVVNHSPTGFAWGYGGSGPAQLAFALLAAVIGPEKAKDPCLYQKFKTEVVAQLDQNTGWEISEDFIRRWLYLPV